MYAALWSQCYFVEIYKHLFTRWSIKNIIIDPPLLRLISNDSGDLKVMYMIPKGLLITWKRCKITIFYEFFFQKIIDRRYAEIIPAVRA